MVLNRAKWWLIESSASGLRQISVVEPPYFPKTFSGEVSTQLGSGGQKSTTPRTVTGMRPDEPGSDS